MLRRCDECYWMRAGNWRAGAGTVDDMNEISEGGKPVQPEPVVACIHDPEQRWKYASQCCSKFKPQTRR